MDELKELKSVTDRLFQKSKGLYLAPIRHHSPACAWALRELIHSEKPAQILIEAPIDFQDKIKILLDKDTLPPVAIAAILEPTDKKSESQKRVAAYYPFCSHSPEYIAIVEAQKIGAEISFIDLPSNDKALLGEESRQEQQNQPIPLNDDLHFNSGDYISALCDKLGCRDGFELWDHLFESRLGNPDWQGFFKDVAGYCTGLRKATTEEAIATSGDAAREAFMASHVIKAIKAQKNKGSVLLVAGGFHIPAILEAIDTNKSIKNVKKGGGGYSSSSYLIRYSFSTLDALNGYGAGLPQPGYYDYLWKCAEAAKGTPDWRKISLDLMSEFSALMREQDYPISLPAMVELLRAAEGLAQLRGRPGAMRYDLIDGAKLALIKGEAAVVDVWTERLNAFFSGQTIGDVAMSAGSPPLVEDARRLARKNRIDLSDGTRRHRKLDIRRNKSQHKASQYFHAMNLLQTGFAEREIGPDFINNIRTDLLFEEWSYAWSPQVEGRLIELSVYGDQLHTACLGVLFNERDEMAKQGKTRNLSHLVELFTSGLLAGLGEKLNSFLQFLDQDIQQFGSFADVATALQKLYFISVSTSPIGATKHLDISRVIQSAYSRLIYLCDDLPQIPEDNVDKCLDALMLTAELLRNINTDILDPELFDEAIDRVVEQNPPPVILGAVLAICFQAGRRDIKALTDALQGYFQGSVSEEERIGILKGILHTAPALLLWEEQLIICVDGFLAELSEENFITLLPHIRLAFTALNPAETDKIAETVAKLHGFNAGSLGSVVLSFDDTCRQQGYQINQALTAALEADGLLADFTPLTPQHGAAS